MMHSLLLFVILLATLCYGTLQQPAPWMVDDSGVNFTFLGGDEFNVDANVVNDSLWTYDVGPHFGIQEADFNTLSNPENANVSGGNLVITARHQPFRGSNYTSARITSRDHFCIEQNYWVSIRAKFPSGLGPWPALWLLGPYDLEWPNTGEIDIFENVGFEAQKVFTTIHAYNITKQQPTSQIGSWAYIIPNGTLYSEFHTYDVKWNATSIAFFTDGVMTYIIPASVILTWWPFTQGRCFELIMNLAIGGAWGGQHGIDNSIFPAAMLVDFVRIYTSNRSVTTLTRYPFTEQVFALSLCGPLLSETLDPQQWEWSSLYRVKNRFFGPFLTKISTTGSTCDMSGLIYVADGSSLYVAPGGHQWDLVRAPDGSLQARNGYQPATAELNSYKGAAPVSDSCCIVHISSSSAPAAPPSDSAWYDQRGFVVGVSIGVALLAVVIIGVLWRFRRARHQSSDVLYAVIAS